LDDDDDDNNDEKESMSHSQGKAATKVQRTFKQNRNLYGRSRNDKVAPYGEMHTLNTNNSIKLGEEKSINILCRRRWNLKSNVHAGVI